MQRSFSELLIQLLDIYSPSHQEQAVVAYIKNFCAERGYMLLVDDKGNSFVSVVGVGEPLLLTAHVDTVTNGIAPKSRLVNGVIQSANGGIPGLDDKASVALFLRLLSELKEKNMPHRPLEVVFTVGEESGCEGASYLMKEKSFPLQSRVGISFDLPKPVGTILRQAAGIWRGRVRFEGQSAHAARPEQGRNALLAAAACITELLGRNQLPDTRVNVGHLIGGSTEAFNMVPAETQFELEIRSLVNLEEELKYFHSVCEEQMKQTGVTITITEEVFRVAACQHPSNDPWLFTLEQGLRFSNFEPQFMPFSFGASDANIFQPNGINVAVLGNGVEHTHTPEERVSLSALEDAYRFLYSLVTNVSGSFVESVTNTTTTTTSIP